MRNKTLVKFYDAVDDALLDFAVIVAKHGGRWVFCKHRDRETYEAPGGRREPGEAIEETARRELYEETGAEVFSLTPVCVYSVTGKTRANQQGHETFGMLYYAEISRFAPLPASEIEQVALFEELPVAWTYPAIQPKLIERVVAEVACQADRFALQTEMPELELRELISCDAPAYFELVQRNREHLTQFGDYKELVAATVQEIEQEFAKPPAGHARMGLWRGQELLGLANLSPVDAPGALVLGYWLGAEYAGQGYMTAACRALLAHGRHQLGATDFWAGVTHGNHKSVALLERLGFTAVERLERHTRFHRQA